MRCRRHELVSSWHQREYPDTSYHHRPCKNGQPHVMREGGCMKRRDVTLIYFAIVLFTSLWRVVGDASLL